MKINNDGPGALTNATDLLPRTRTADQAGAGKTPPAAGGADALKLSADAQLLQTIAERSVGAPAIRQDVVDRMRALLDAGKVGDNADALADAIIDDLTTGR